MAKKEKERHVASQLNITYTIPRGVVHMLASASGKSIPEIWCEISDMANICAFRLSTKIQRDSWTQATFPGTQIKLRIDMQKWGDYDIEGNKARYSANVKISGSTIESFSQKQINDYITESILLGLDEDDS